MNSKPSSLKCIRHETEVIFTSIEMMTLEVCYTAKTEYIDTTLDVDDSTANLSQKLIH